MVAAPLVLSLTNHAFGTNAVMLYPLICVIVAKLRPVAALELSTLETCCGDPKLVADISKNTVPALTAPLVAVVIATL